MQVVNSRYSRSIRDCMTIITLTTDFGQKDGFVGILKGVIWKISPSVKIADISHEIPAQKILEAALVLRRAYSFFPAGSIHVAVVDPGVGTLRRPIGMKAGDQFFVGPDNGIFTPILEDAVESEKNIEIHHLINTHYLLEGISNTFHGRDIFAPVAAHLANGVPIGEFGPSISDPKTIQIPKPEIISNGWKAHIIGVDRFGNLTTDFVTSRIKEKMKCLVRMGKCEITGIIETYGERPAGTLIALTDSMGFLELAAVGGSAAEITCAKVGDIVEVLE